MPKLTIICSNPVWKLYDMSVRRRMPETYAILGGRLDDPFRVTDFRPMAPTQDRNGRENASASHVQINKHYIDHYLNNELIPAGKYMLGAWHSHPGQLKTLSRGRPGSGDGDIASMKGTLERARELGIPWHYFLAPLTTFNVDHSADEITGWAVTLDDPDPIPAKIVFEPHCEATPVPTGSPDFATPAFPLGQIVSCANAYQGVINGIRGDGVSPEEDRVWMESVVRGLMREDVSLKLRALGNRDGATADPDERTGT
jgi:hypothetical protein